MGYRVNLLAMNPTLGDTISKLRIAAGLSVRQLSIKSGISRATLFNLEHGIVSDPKLSVVAALARALNVAPAVFFRTGDRCWSVSRWQGDDPSGAPAIIEYWRWSADPL
jgi:transcriptional regulator with XRE-family HTH domain